MIQNWVHVKEREKGGIDELFFPDFTFLPPPTSTLRILSHVHSLWLLQFILAGLAAPLGQSRFPPISGHTGPNHFHAGLGCRSSRVGLVAGKGSLLLCEGKPSALSPSTEGALALTREKWATSGGSEDSEEFVALKSSGANTQISPFHVSESQVFPTRTLTLA